MFLNLNTLPWWIFLKITLVVLRIKKDIFDSTTFKLYDPADLLAGIIARENPISETIQNILTVLISILTSMLFALLTTIIQMKAKIKEDLDYYSIEANTQNRH